MSNKTGPSKEERERAVFVRYLQATGLATDAHRVESRKPPEPDILYTPDAGAPVAFELVEILDQGYSRSVNRQLNTGSMCYEFLDKYPQAPAIRQKYPNADILLSFSSESSELRRRNILPKIFEKLLALPDGAAGDVLEQDAELFPVLEYAHIVRGRFVGPLFSAPGGISVGDPTVAALKDKFTKKYSTPYRMELLAYVNNAAMFPDDIWLPTLQQYFDGLSKAPFAAIVVLDLRRERDEVVARWSS